MAAKTQLRGVLVLQHVTVGGTMHIMTGRAAFDPRGPVLIEKRPAFIGMAFETGFVLKAGQPFPYGWTMGIVAGGTF